MGGKTVDYAMYHASLDKVPDGLSLPFSMPSHYERCTHELFSFTLPTLRLAVFLRHFPSQFFIRRKYRIS